MSGKKVKLPRTLFSLRENGLQSGGAFKVSQTGLTEMCWPFFYYLGFLNTNDNENHKSGISIALLIKSGIKTGSGRF